MQIVYRGGFNKLSPQSESHSILYEYKDHLLGLAYQGRRIGFITLAKVDGYYDERLMRTYGSKISIINSKSVVTWSDYDVLILLGGSSLELIAQLALQNFSVENLKQDIVLIGDGAGAEVLSAYFFQEVPLKNGKNHIIFHEGLVPASQLICITHYDNPTYINSKIVDRVTTFADNKKISVLNIRENESFTLDTSGHPIPFIFSSRLF
jgi:hypothetical protein